MPVITITRQFGAGGSEVARRVAAALDWTLVDNDFIDRVARRSGLPAETVAAHEERAPSLDERLARALATSSPEMFVPAAAELDPGSEEEKVVRVTERVIAEAVQQGPVVLVGRGAQAVLSGGLAPDALHVYVVAPRETRIATLVQRLGLTSAAAARTLDDTESSRDRYVNQWYHRDRQDPANYHLVVNTGWIGYDGAAAVIADMARRHRRA